VQDLLEQETTLRRNEILTCFDLDLKADTRALSDTLHRGLWAMYGTACDYPYVPRMVVTGYRSQTALSHGAGAHAYLMKPFTVDRLHDALKEARDVRRVTWVCPEDVKDNYNALVSSLDEDSTEGEGSSDSDEASGSNGEEHPHFESMKGLLRHHLRKKRVALNVEGTDPGREHLIHSDLVILDPFKVQRKGLQDGESQQYDPPEPQRLIEKVRSVNADVPLLLVLPRNGKSNSDDNTNGGSTDEDDNDLGRWKPENVVAEFFRGSSLRLREEEDAVVRKPTWLAATGYPDPEAGFADQIFSLLDNENRFDVKYQVLIPVAAVLGRFGKRIHGMYQEMHDEEDLDRVFSPLLPFLVQAYGLSASLHDLCAIESAELASTLRSQVRRDQRQNREDWSHVDERTIDDVLGYFASKGIHHSSVRKYVTLENWMRNMVDRNAREEYQHLDPENGGEGGSCPETVQGGSGSDLLCNPV